MEEGAMAEQAVQQIGALAVILSLDIARLVRHRMADNSILWLQAASSAHEVLTLALEESAGTRDSDTILRAARETLGGFLNERATAAGSNAA
jgi:hypothetical protein